MNDFRILLTGSRRWTETAPLYAGLRRAVQEARNCRPVLVHGGCPSGVDHLADEWARHHGVVREVHRAEDFGWWPACGPLRNSHMVHLGADVALALIGPCTSPRCTRQGVHGSHGATHCAELARASGISVHVYRAKSLRVW